MNYFAHGYRFVDDPYFLAGTAIPDWLSAVDRGVRVRGKRAQLFLADDDPRRARLAAGIVQHHRDDAWFHETAAFAELNWQFTVLVREALPADEGFRPSFLGHILIEIVLDAVLIERNAAALTAYYNALEVLDGDWIQSAVNEMAPVATERLAAFVPLFSRERFLSDYADDAKLCYRLNQVMRRVGLPTLPIEFRGVLPEIRGQVARRAGDLLRAP